MATDANTSAATAAREVRGPLPLGHSRTHPNIRPDTACCSQRTPKNSPRLGTVPVGAHPTTWVRGHWARTGTGRTAKPSTTYYHKHNDYYEETSTTTQKADSARAASTSTDALAPTTAPQKVDGPVTTGTRASTSLPGLPATASLLTDASAPAATSTYTEVLSAGTTTLKDARASSTYSTCHTHHESKLTSDDRTPLIPPGTTQTSTPMYVVLDTQHVPRYIGHTVNNDTVLARTLEHWRTGAAVLTDAQASSDTSQTVCIASTVLTSTPAPTGAPHITLPCLAVYTPGTCPTDAQASTDTEQPPGRTCSTAPADPATSASTAACAHGVMQTSLTVSRLQHTSPTDAQASDGTERLTTRTPDTLSSGAQSPLRTQHTTTRTCSTTLVDAQASSDTLKISSTTLHLRHLPVPGDAQAPPGTHTYTTLTHLPVPGTDLASVPTLLATDQTVVPDHFVYSADALTSADTSGTTTRAYDAIHTDAQASGCTDQATDILGQRRDVLRLLRDSHTSDTKQQLRQYSLQQPQQLLRRQQRPRSPQLHQLLLTQQSYWL